MTVKKLASVQEQTRWILQKFIDLFSNLLQASTGHRKPPRGPQFAHPYLRQIIYVEEEEGWTLIVWVNYLMYYSRILIRCYEYIIKLFFFTSLETSWQFDWFSYIFLLWVSCPRGCKRSDDNKMMGTSDRTNLCMRMKEFRFEIRFLRECPTQNFHLR